MNDIGLAFKGQWAVIGDFNVVLDQRDKKGGSLVALTSNSGFRNMININGLMDLGFIGSHILGVIGEWVILISRRDWIGLL